MRKLYLALAVYACVVPTHAGDDDAKDVSRLELEIRQIREDFLGLAAKVEEMKKALVTAGPGLPHSPLPKLEPQPEFALKPEPGFVLRPAPVLLEGWRYCPWCGHEGFGQGPK